MVRDPEEERKFAQWMDDVSGAAYVHCAEPDGIYCGEEGAMRLGRECGYAIADFRLDPRRAISATYSGICVRAYWLKPPISNDKWSEAVWQGYNKITGGKRCTKK